MKDATWDWNRPGTALRVIALGASARVVDVFGAKAADPIAARIAAHTNQAFDDGDMGLLDYSSKDRQTIAKNPNIANAFKRERSRRAGQGSRRQGPEAVHAAGRRARGVRPGLDPHGHQQEPERARRYHLTTTGAWGDHVYKCAPAMGPGVGIIWR